MVFKSAVDRWFYALLVSLAALALWIYAGAFLAGEPRPLLDTLVGLGLGLGLPLWLLFSTDYTVTEDSLRVRSGPFRWRIDRASIHSIRPSRSVLSSPALSLDRLRVRYDGDRSLLISPADRDGFLGAIGLPLDGARPSS